MDEEKTITVNRNGSPVVLHIVSGYATLGSYSIAYVLNDQTVFLGRGSLGDAIPDVYILPVAINDLPNCTVFIAGTFVPSPGHSQIAVKYEFLQNSKPTGGDNPITINVVQPALSATHTIHFKLA